MAFVKRSLLLGWRNRKYPAGRPVHEVGEARAEAAHDSDEAAAGVGDRGVLGVEGFILTDENEVDRYTLEAGRRGAAHDELAGEGGGAVRRGVEARRVRGLRKRSFAGAMPGTWAGTSISSLNSA